MQAEPSDAIVGHYENFPVASWLCPAHLRAPIAAIYGFARTADDIADEGQAPASQRLDDLAAIRTDLVAVHGGQAHSGRWPAVFTPLGAMIAQYRLPIGLLTDLLDAFVQDVVKSRDGAGYATQGELLDYCRLSANPVGRLVLHLYGVADSLALQNSDDICTALQLINFWQDLGLDIKRGRFYLPFEDCARHGVLPTHLRSLRQTSEVTALITEQVGRAKATMLRGSGLVKRVPGRAGWELRLVVQGGLRILEKIEDLQFATLQHRPKLSPWDIAVMGYRALRM